MKIKYLFYCIYIIIILIVPYTFFVSAYESSSIEITNKVNSLDSVKIGVNDVSAIQEKVGIETGVRAILMRENVCFHGVLRRVAGSPPVRPDLDSVHMTNVLT